VRRERKTLLADVVQGRADMDERRLVDDEEVVMELVRPFAVIELSCCALNYVTSTAWSGLLREFFATRADTPCRFCAKNGRIRSVKV